MIKLGLHDHEGLNVYTIYGVGTRHFWTCKLIFLYAMPNISLDRNFAQVYVEMLF